MNVRKSCLFVLHLTIAALVVGCAASPTLTSIQVTPSTATASIGGTIQFSATATYTHGSHPPSSRDVTGEVTWSSSSDGIAMVSAGGQATALGSGTVSLIATMAGSSGPITGSASLEVTSDGSSGGGARTLTAITITPNTQTLHAIGETAQLIALGTFSSSPTTQDMAGQVTWRSSDTSLASVDSNGEVTAIGCASSSCVATITATATAESGNTIVGTATITVTPGSPANTRTLTNITIVPGTGTQILYTLGETAQFIAIGTFNASPVTEDLTNQVVWQSVDVGVATINSAGLVTAVSCALTAGCTTAVTANAISATGAVIIATSDITVNPGAGGSNLPSLAIYTVGAGTGTIVSNPSGINCTSGNADGCTGFFVSGQTVTLTATPSSGHTFGGWSANCMPSTASTCTVVMNGNQTVGAIFN
jgi:hypothetical protein